MNSSYGKSNNKTDSADAFDFGLGLSSGPAKPLNGQKSQMLSYAQQKPKTTSSWTHQPSGPAWNHQPADPVQSSESGSLSGPTSMVGDIFGKSWNSSAPSSSSASGIGIVNSKNPNLFGDLLSSAIGQNKSSDNVPLKNSAPIASGTTFPMGDMSNSLPKTGNSGINVGNFGGNYNKNSSHVGGNVNLGGNSTVNSNLGSSFVKNMTVSGVVGGGMGSIEDPFGSLLDFGSKPSVCMNSTSKGSVENDFGSLSFEDSRNTTSKTNGSPLPSSPGDFGFFNNSSNSQSQPSKQSPDTNDFDALFSSPEGFTSNKVSEESDWKINPNFVGGNDTVTELEGLPPPPAGISASVAKSKGMDNYKQGQFSDAIKWLSWAVILLEKAGDDDGTVEVLSSRSSCYKEVGEYKKAVADCTKGTKKMFESCSYVVQVLERDGKNTTVLVQRALLYESMEKYNLGAEDLRTVMNIDPGNRIARSTIHRLIKMAG
ncbi:hypothetical protein OROGR_025291 [Orobanche gracilis]